MKRRHSYPRAAHGKQAREGGPSRAPVAVDPVALLSRVPVAKEFDEAERGYVAAGRTRNILTRQVADWRVATS